MTTPINDIAMYDHLDPLDAAIEAWKNHGPNPAWHDQMRDRVRRTMPLLGRALDRAVIDAHRARLDGTTGAVVSLLSNIPRDQLDQYGGVNEPQITG